MKKLPCLLKAALLCLLFSSAAFAAEPYPSKPVELVVPYPPGGGTDNVGRLVAESVKNLLPQPTIVINKPGASGTIGWSYVANSPADGYKILVMTAEMMLVPLMGIGKTTIDDFEPIARLTEDPLAITVRTDAPWKTVEEFIAHVKANPGGVAISHSGNGSTPHLGAVALSEKLGLKLTQIPYQGSAPAAMGVLSGDVAATTLPYADLSAFVTSGKMRVLAVMSEKRMEGLTDVPTMKERGYDLQYGTWRGIGVAKSTPKPVVEQWRTILHQMTETEAFQSSLKRMNSRFAYADTPDFLSSISREKMDFKKMAPLMVDNK